ncbi:hypothetical protein J7426_08615 [Tropicibacter sp. R16_0]|uniref:hypothetical protein n=1 Tax=Tropicibacter sp. R16_0 TaxID=2821102 RepID=UPI001ADCDE43|nr:hypothetical protein [Tropicibacter sp. R16_0]MBO9450313.1 hypothetical protein [Tropicibacter sp. R16_0]
MVLLYFSPLIFLGLHLLAIIDLRYENGRKREFIRIAATGALPILFASLSLFWIAPEPPLNWKVKAFLLLAALFYAKSGIDLIHLRKTGIAPIRLHAALTVWAISITFYVASYIL